MTFFPRKLNRVPRNLLIARTDRVGDFILSLPTFQAAKEYLGAKVSVLCRDYAASLLNNNPFADQAIAVTPEKTRHSLIKEIKENHFDALLVLVNDDFILDLLPDLKSIPVRIGPLSKLSALFHYTHPAFQKRSRSIMNEAEYNLKLLGIFGLKEIRPVRPALRFSSEESEDFRSKLDRAEASLEKITGARIVLHAGMGGSALNYSLEYYSRLLEKLLEAGFNVFLTGSGPSEQERNRRLAGGLKKELSRRILDFSDKLSLRELALLISFSDLFIGPSTGPTHLANAAGVPLISFYPPVLVQSAARWEPYLADSHIFAPQVDCGRKYKCAREKCRHFYCMDLIDPQEVFNKAKEFIES